MHNIIYMNSTTDAECPLGDCNGEGEHIVRQTDLKENNLELDSATVWDCRRFNGWWSLHTHKARCCKQCNSIKECKSNDGGYESGLHPSDSIGEQQLDLLTKESIKKIKCT